MGRTKDLQIEIRATMEQYVFDQIPSHLREEMKMERLTVTNFDDEYKKSPEWVEAKKVMTEAIKAKKEIEEQIRTEIRNG